MQQPERQELRLGAAGIKTMNTSVIETIDLSRNLGPKLHKLGRLSKHTTVIHTYVRPNREQSVQGKVSAT